MLPVLLKRLAKLNFKNAELRNFLQYELMKMLTAGITGYFKVFV